MRSFIGFCLLLACSNDTFTDSDASSNDANVIDQQLPNDVATALDAAPNALDTSSFSNDAVLWFDAADATISNGMVTAWPPHNSNPNIHTTLLTGGPQTACGTNGIHYTSSSVNKRPSVQFCQSLIRIDDDSSLRLGSDPFMITAVMRTNNASANGVLIAKTQAGQTYPFSQLAFWGRTPGDGIEGDLTGSESTDVVNQSQDFVYVSFVRLTSANQNSTINLRLEGAAGTPIIVVSSDDVSFGGNPYQIGGSIFDVGNYQNVFGGDLAELIVLRNTTDIQIGHVEAYLKTKYALQ